MMLKEQTHLYVGGARLVAGCGEGTALRMLCRRRPARSTATTGASSPRPAAIRSTRRPIRTIRTMVPWTNSLFENAPAYAMGVRMRWDQMGWQDRPLWCIGGDGAMFDIGFQSLSRMLASGMDIKVFVLDTQVYSNTGGQASTSSYTGQNTKMSVHGKALGGKQERREGDRPDRHDAPAHLRGQTTCAPHQPLLPVGAGRLEFDGPAIVFCYTTCQPEHGVADNMAGEQARLAVDTRAFPLLVFDPRKGDAIKERLSLQGNPRAQGRLVRRPQDQGGRHLRRLRPQRGRFSERFDRMATPRRRSCEPGRIVSRTGDSCRSWQGRGDI